MCYKVLLVQDNGVQRVSSFIHQWNIWAIFRLWVGVWTICNENPMHIMESDSLYTQGKSASVWKRWGWWMPLENVFQFWQQKFSSFTSFLCVCCAYSVCFIFSFLSRCTFSPLFSWSDSGFGSSFLPKEESATTAPEVVVRKDYQASSQVSRFLNFTGWYLNLEIFGTLKRAPVVFGLHILTLKCIWTPKSHH